jgi:3-mercaptopyruvate sulfurtransferase SseA
VAKVLVNHGFKRVRPLFGGLDAWIAAGHAVESEAAQVSGTQAEAAQLPGGRAAIETEP